MHHSSLSHTTYVETTDSHENFRLNCCDYVFGVGRMELRTEVDSLLMQVSSSVTNCLNDKDKARVKIHLHPPSTPPFLWVAPLSKFNLFNVLCKQTALNPFINDTKTMFGMPIVTNHLNIITLSSVGADLTRGVNRRLCRFTRYRVATPNYSSYHSVMVSR